MSPVIQMRGICTRYGATSVHENIDLAAGALLGGLMLMAILIHLHSLRADLDADRLELVRPRLSTVLFPRLRDVSDTSAFADRLLSERQTAVVPGRFFEAPAHFRIGLGTRTEVVRGGLEQLAAALAEPIR